MTSALQYIRVDQQALTITPAANDQVNKSFQDLCQASPMPKCVQMALQQTSTAARLTSPSSAERRRQQRLSQEQAQLGRSSQDGQWSKGRASLPESSQSGLSSSGERARHAGANGQSVVSASSSTTMTFTSSSSQQSMRPPPPVMASLDEQAGAAHGRRSRGSGEGKLKTSGPYNGMSKNLDCPRRTGPDKVLCWREVAFHSRTELILSSLDCSEDLTHTCGHLAGSLSSAGSREEREARAVQVGDHCPSKIHSTHLSSWPSLVGTRCPHIIH